MLLHRSGDDNDDNNCGEEAAPPEDGTTQNSAENGEEEEDPQVGLILSMLNVTLTKVTRCVVGRSSGGGHCCWLCRYGSGCRASIPYTSAP